MSDLDSAIGANLKAARLQSVVTQAELADAIGVDRTTITKWETGQRSLTVAHLLQIARVLDIAPQDLLHPPKPATGPAPHLTTVVIQQQALQAITRTLQQNPDLIAVVLQTMQQQLKQSEPSPLAS